MSIIGPRREDIMTTVVGSNQGECPVCGSECISYGAVEIVDEQLYYPATCDDCGITFKEWYRLYYIDSVWDVQKRIYKSRKENDNE